MMPPSGTKRPDPAVLDALATTLETRIDAAAAGHPHPGGCTFQRLNRLLGVDFMGARHRLGAPRTPSTSRR